jgi:hypothetical protein
MHHDYDMLYRHTNRLIYGYKSIIHTYISHLMQHQYDTAHRSYLIGSYEKSSTITKFSTTTLPVLSMLLLLLLAGRPLSSLWSTELLRMDRTCYHGMVCHVVIKLHTIGIMMS